MFLNSADVFNLYLLVFVGFLAQNGILRKEGKIGKGGKRKREGEEQGKGRVQRRKVWDSNHHVLQLLLFWHGICTTPATKWPHRQSAQKGSTWFLETIWPWALRPFISFGCLKISFPFSFPIRINKSRWEDKNMSSRNTLILWSQNIFEQSQVTEYYPENYFFWEKYQ